MTTITALRVDPVQRRSQERLAQLTAAAEQAIALYGVERFTTADVARLAGVSIGTVYRYFIDRVAILDVVRPGRHDAEATLAKVRVFAENNRQLRGGREVIEDLFAILDGNGGDTE